MMRLWFLLLCALLVTPALAAEQEDYLYFRDVSISPYQKLREFFDMPNRAGLYQITLVSDSVGPLTFTISRVVGDVEKVVKKVRSYAVGDHEFHYSFDNSTGEDDLLVEIANSNPVLGANLSVIVVELPEP